VGKKVLALFLIVWRARVTRVKILGKRIGTVRYVPHVHVNLSTRTNQKEAATLRQHALEIPEDTIQNMGITTGKMMMRTICFDHITTATTPLPNL